MQTEHKRQVWLGSRSLSCGVCKRKDDTITTFLLTPCSPTQQLSAGPASKITIASMSAPMILSRRQGNRSIARRLRAEKRNLRKTSFYIYDVDFDRDAADALLAVFRLSVRAGRTPLEGLYLFRCHGNEHLDLILETAVAMRVFSMILIQSSEEFYSSGQSKTILIPGDSIKSEDCDEQGDDCDEQGDDCDEHGEDCDEEEDDYDFYIDFDSDEGLVTLPSSLQQEHMSFRPFGVPVRLCRYLRRLHLTQVTLSRVEMQMLGQALMGGWDGNGADQTNHETDNAHVSIGEGIANWPTMQYPNRQSQLGLISLELSRTVLFGVEEDAFDQFCIGLQNSPSLRYLAFFSCYLTDGHIEQIIHVLMDGTCSQRCRSSITEPGLPLVSSTCGGKIAQEPPQQTPEQQCCPPSHPRHGLRLRLVGVQCHERGFLAINQWLSRPDCFLEVLEISQPLVAAAGHTMGVDRGGTVRGGTYSTNDPHRHAGNHVRHEDPDDVGTNSTNVCNNNPPEYSINGVSMGLKLLAQNWDTPEPMSGTSWSTNNSLKGLWLLRNQLSDDVMPALAELVQNRFLGLEELNLEGNKITNAGLASFAQESAQQGPGVSVVRGLHDLRGPVDNLGSGFKFSPSRLRALRLEGNAIVPELASTSVAQILQVYANLRLVTPTHGWDKETKELL